MKTRRAFVFGLCAASAAVSVVVACGGGQTGGSDSGMDASMGGDTTTMFDVPMHDDKSTTDMTVNDTGGGDAGQDVVMKMDADLKGHCSPVNGPACDIVLQNCPKNQECVIVNDPKGGGLGVTTACQPTTSGEHLPMGSTCCPGPTNQCDPGMTCVGAACANDAGGGRCTPACCPGDAGPIQANCGSSPEGYIGVCSLNLTEADSAVLYTTCLYASTCTPFVNPCGPGYTCIVEDKSGTSKCVGIFEEDGGTKGLKPGAVCASANSCATDLECISFLRPDGGAMPYECTYLCYTGTGSPPFDAGALTGKPGSGGCPAKYTCEADPMNLPSWLGLCAPP